MNGISALPDRSVFTLAALLLSAGWLGGCNEADFPRDPDRTLETVLSTGKMTVAAVDHPPWVIIDGDAPPSGAEVALISAFADDLGVDVTWRRLSAFDALDGLEQGALDLAIGGFTETAMSPHKVAGPTYPYFSEDLVVAARPGTDVPSRLDGAPVFVPPDVMADELLRDEGAVPTTVMDARIDLAAVPRWQVASLGFQPTGTRLRQEKHVMIVPQGENAWLMRLETFLRSHAADMAVRLREHDR